VIDDQLGKCRVGLAASAIVECDDVVRWSDLFARLWMQPAVDLYAESVCVASDCAHSPPFRSPADESKANGWCDKPVQLGF